MSAKSKRLTELTQKVDEFNQALKDEYGFTDFKTGKKTKPKRKSKAEKKTPNKDHRNGEASDSHDQGKTT